ncbi:MAG: hypothetical protein ACR2OH_09200 [Microthrixaceae bacterium]
MKIRDEVAVVTGGTRGVVLANAQACRDESAEVAAFGRPRSWVEVRDRGVA